MTGKKLRELQGKAGEKGGEYFFLGRGYDCVSSTLLALNDTQGAVDSVGYADPMILKAASPLPAGFGLPEGPCGVVTAGAMAIGLKYGSPDPSKQDTVESAWLKSRSWLQWFKQSFGSINCSDLTHGADLFSEEGRKEFLTGQKVVKCNTILIQSLKKLVEVLSGDMGESQAKPRNGG